MGHLWLDTETDGEAASHATDFWAAMRAGLDAGDFWADRIKGYRDQPGKRLQMAMENLPLPAAFREGAISLRAMIRSRRKAGLAWNSELGLLYWLAAIESFALPYADKLQEPGFNVIESIPGKQIRSLRIDYRQLGYKNLSLLNPTDKRWLVEAWGEPQAHSTLNDLHRQLWDEYEQKLIVERQMERQAFSQELRQFLETGGNADRVRPPLKPRRFRVFMFCVLVTVIIWICVGKLLT